MPQPKREIFVETLNEIIETLKGYLIDCEGVPRIAVLGGYWRREKLVHQLSLMGAVTMTIPGESKALKLVNFIVDSAVQGVPTLKSSKELAEEYLNDCAYATADDRINALIRWECSKNFTSGFITGLGGILTLPLSIPSALGASWVIQARLAGTIGNLYGHDPQSDRVRTLILLSLLGDACKEVLKEVGVKISTKISEKVVLSIPGKLFIEINKRIGFRLLTKAGEKGVINLMKCVPIVGGGVSGIFDAATCQAVGKTAKSLFQREVTEPKGEEGTE